MTVLLDGMLVLTGSWRMILGMLGSIAILSLPFLILHVKSNKAYGPGQRPAPVSVSTGMFLALFFAITLLPRLGYVHKALFPSYFDSAQHYALIKYIMTRDASSVIDMLRSDYYHLGYHTLVAFFVSVFHVEISTTMLLLGQVILAFLPLPIHFIVKQMTRSEEAGWFAMVLSTFGWSMPGHAVDWGKYPALLSMGMILFVLSVVYILLQAKGELHGRKRAISFGMLAAGILASIFVHSRSLIVFGILAIAWFLSKWWEGLPPRLKRSVFALLIAALFLEIVVIQRSDTLSLLFDPYLKGGSPITALVLFLSIPAFKSHPRSTFICLMVIFFLLAGLYIPVGYFPGREYLTVMDRPYVEMILFLPLSLLGGLGLAGLGSWMRGRFTWNRLAGFAAIGIVAGNAFLTFEPHPSDCCVIMGNNDVTAMVWMEDRLPADARIGISSVALKVVDEDVPEGSVGADAGVWIKPLTERDSIPLPGDLDFEQRNTLDLLCRRKISHLFVGELGQTFEISGLISRPEWYRPLLSISRTRVYEVTGC